MNQKTEPIPPFRILNYSSQVIGSEFEPEKQNNIDYTIMKKKGRMRMHEISLPIMHIHVPKGVPYAESFHDDAKHLSHFSMTCKIE